MSLRSSVERVEKQKGRLVGGRYLPSLLVGSRSIRNATRGPDACTYVRELDNHDDTWQSTEHERRLGRRGGP
jgi:hypothetical protein